MRSRAPCHASTDVGFRWVTPLLLHGAETALQEGDLFPLARPEEDSAAAVNARLRGLLRADPSLHKALWQLVRREVVCSGGLQLLYACCQLTTPLLVRRFILEVEDPSAESWAGWVTSAGLCASMSLGALANQHHLHGMVHVGLVLRTAIISCVFGQMLSMNSTERASVSRGELLNLMSNDATKIFETASLVHLCWSAPLQILISAYLLWVLIGPAAGVGAGAVCLIIPISKFIANWNMRVRKSHMAVSDKRVKLCSEVLRAIKVVKTYGWESSFVGQITTLRAEEMALAHTEAQIYAM
jgi:ABC-type multidrug transport system fused ATPase/permease subunit